MSTIRTIKCICSVCAEESEQRVLASSNQFGASDLDLRPPEMLRSTMSFWIQECPHCGYVSENIEDDTTIDKEFLKSTEYSSCSNNDFKSELAKMFYRYYMINLLDDNCDDAFHAILHAAWSCDDVGDKDKAVYCRKLAIVELEKIIDNTNKEILKVQKADLLRRAGLFNLVINEYSDLNFKDEILQKIISFQIEKSNQEDIKCYTVADVLE